jgi:hypothetical protein
VADERRALGVGQLGQVLEHSSDGCSSCQDHGWVAGSGACVVVGQLDVVGPADLVDRVVAHEPVEPCPQLADRLAGHQRHVGGDEGVLHDVLGV